MQTLQQIAADLRVIELDGEWFGMATADEIAEMRAESSIPEGATDRPATVADLK